MLRRLLRDGQHPRCLRADAAEEPCLIRGQCCQGRRNASVSLPIMEDLSRRNIWSGGCLKLTMTWLTLATGSRTRMMTIQILLCLWPVQLLAARWIAAWPSAVVA